MTTLSPSDNEINRRIVRSKPQDDGRLLTGNFTLLGKNKLITIHGTDLFAFAKSCSGTDSVTQAVNQFSPLAYTLLECSPNAFNPLLYRMDSAPTDSRFSDNKYINITFNRLRETALEAPVQQQKERVDTLTLMNQPTTVDKSKQRTSTSYHVKQGCLPGWLVITCSHPLVLLPIIHFIKQQLTLQRVMELIMIISPP